ncbi:MAG: hypothetical protein Q9214_002308 [Letrouitia sp. 1 TL-2023]
MPIPVIDLTSMADTVQDPPSKCPKKMAQPDTDTKSIPLDTEDDDFSSFLTKDMVTIHVGQKRKQFHIHRNLLCAKSAFFQAAFSAAPPAAAGSDPDSKVRLRTAIYLEEKDPDAFGLFVDWLYKDKFVGPVYEAPPPQQIRVSVTAPTAGEKTNGRFQGTTAAIVNGTIDQNYRVKLTLLLNLHGMALQWGFPALQNLCIDRMRAYNAQSRAIFHPEHLAQIYQQTGTSFPRTATEGREEGGVEVVGDGGYDSAPLRQYAVRQFLARVMDKKVVSKIPRARMVRNRVGVAGSQFMEEVFQALAVQHRRKAVEDVEGMEGCIFHVHGAEEKCAEDG